MVHLFVDTDVLLDFLGERNPFSKFALQVFLEADKKHFKLYTSGNSVTTAYYILSKYADEPHARELIIDILDYVQVVAVTSRILKHAFESVFKDVEDAVQHYCALTIPKISCLVTRNLRDYKHSQIEVLTPEEILRKFT
jgi:predicted nucleic acid-binding protein